MAKRKIHEAIIIGGAGLSLGSTVVGKMGGNINGLGVAGKAFTMASTIACSGLVTNQLRRLKNEF